LSRRRPVLKIQNLNTTTYVADQIVESSGIFAVLYKKELMNYRKLSVLLNKDMHVPTYKRTMFSTRQSAISLCNKLNKLFETDDFTVVSIPYESQT
jgi:hypothetical protein